MAGHFRDRERGEEEAISSADAKPIAKLRQKAQFSEIAHALAEKLHATNRRFSSASRSSASRSYGFGVHPAPLVESQVDGDVSHAERDTILCIVGATRPGLGPPIIVASRLACPPPT
jgi:hypothetical protein